MAGEEKSDTKYLDNLELENKKLRTKNIEYETYISNTSFNTPENSNIVELQIEMGDILEMIEHFLKGDIQVTDGEGNTYYSPPTKTIKVKEKGKMITKAIIDHNLIILNSFGVNSIMHILGNYINKNTTLSFYTEERINEILADLGDEINKFILCNYEKMGMTTAFKKSKYELIVITILHAIESAYRKSIGGETMKEINRNTNIIQSENLGQTRATPILKKQWHPLKPSTW